MKIASDKTKTVQQILFLLDMGPLHNMTPLQLQ